MPSGRTHQNINQTILITIVLIALFSIPIPQDYVPSQNSIVWFFILGLAIGINYLNPDLDKNNTHPDQHWGIFGKIWNIYAWLMPHRGLSHNPILGFITRYIFISIMCFVFYFIISIIVLWKYHLVNDGNIINIFDSFWFKFNQFVKYRKLIIAPVTAGIMTGDLLHVIEDKIGSFIKKHRIRK